MCATAALHPDEIRASLGYTARLSGGSEGLQRSNQSSVTGVGPADAQVTLGSVAPVVVVEPHLLQIYEGRLGHV